MLPNFLQSSYQTYKEDTDYIAKWLAVKAKQCGYPADLLSTLSPPSTSSHPARPSQRLKGAARKKAKNVAKGEAAQSENPDSRADPPRYTIKVKDFTALAECIARFRKPAVQVPVTIVKALNRAIELRQQHNIWSRDQAESKMLPNAESDESHSHFLGILESTRETLKSRMPSDMLNDFLSEPSQATGRVQSEKQVNGKIGNMFGNLDIEEPSQTFVDAPDIETTIGIKTVNEPNYEAEKLQSLEEQYLAAYCLFQDVKIIRSFLGQLWANYKDGALSLVSVSITTNTAVDFVRRMEQDILQQFPDMSDYQSIVELFYKSQCLYRGHDPNGRQRAGDFFNFEVYDLTEEVMMPTYIVLEALQKAARPGQIPLYKPGFFGVRDTSTEWTQKSARDKSYDDRLILTEAFPDLMLLSTVTTRFALAEDELMRGIRQVAPGKIIPLWLVFATQCFLDIQHALGRDVAHGHTELQRTANTIRASIQQNLRFHESLRTETWPRGCDTDFSRSLTIIEEWVGQDLVALKMKNV